LVYINDVPRHVQGINFVLYADDTNILLADKEEVALQHKITIVMRQLELWLSKNDLIVNIDKTCAISFHPYQKNHPTKPHITFNNNVTAYSSELKFLGLCIMEALTWQAQIHSLYTILSEAITLLNR
jgi:hypothetical protein